MNNLNLLLKLFLNVFEITVNLINYILKFKYLIILKFMIIFYLN